MEVVIDWSLGRRRRYRRTVDADVSACGRFAIHRSDPSEYPQGWRVTHLPTGYFILTAKYKRDARKALKEIAATKGRWSSRQPQVVVESLRDQVKPIVQKYDVRYPSFVELAK